MILCMFGSYPIIKRLMAETDPSKISEENCDHHSNRVENEAMRIDQDGNRRLYSSEPKLKGCKKYQLYSTANSLKSYIFSQL